MFIWRSAHEDPASRRVNLCDLKAVLRLVPRRPVVAKVCSNDNDCDRKQSGEHPTGNRPRFRYSSRNTVGVGESGRKARSLLKPLPNRGALARQLMGAGRRWLKPGADPVGDLIREREQDDKLDQADERQ